MPKKQVEKITAYPQWDDQKFGWRLTAPFQFVLSFFWREGDTKVGTTYSNRRDFIHKGEGNQFPPEGAEMRGKKVEMIDGDTVETCVQVETPKGFPKYKKT